MIFLNHMNLNTLIDITLRYQSTYLKRGAV